MHYGFVNYCHCLLGVWIWRVVKKESQENDEKLKEYLILVEVLLHDEFVM